MRRRSSLLMAGVMILRRQPGLLTLYPQRVTLTQVTNAEEALELLAAVRDLVNRTWEQRAQICCRAATVASAGRRPAWPSPLACCKDVTGLRSARRCASRKLQPNCWRCGA